MIEQEDITFGAELGEPGSSQIDAETYDFLEKCLAIPFVITVNPSE